VRRAFERAYALEVHGADVGDQPDVGIRPPGEARDLAKVVHARLDHRVEVPGREAQ